MDPIVAFIPTYKEGTLVQGAIRSVTNVAEYIIVYDGSTDAADIQGEQTQLGEWIPDIYLESSWETESAKRNEMLNCARRLIGDNFWILNIDADEILVWGENLPDYLSALNPGVDSEENIPSFKRTEGVFVPLPPFPPLHYGKENWSRWRKDITTHVEKWAYRQPGIFTDHAPSRLYHSTLIDEFVVSSWQIKTPNGITIALTHGVSEYPPIYGEPHLHHRPYLRRGERTGYRASFQGEEAKYMEAHGIEKASFTVKSN